MTATDILNYFKGYVTVSIKGRQPERFINLVTRENIYLWDVKRKDGEIVFKVSKKGFRLLRAPAYKTGIKVKILKKKGFFLVVRKIKRKKLLTACLLTAFVLLNLLSSFVLKIEVVGNEQIPTEKIIDKLAEIDLKKFSLRSNIDVERISLELRNGFDLIAWVGVYEKGTGVTVEIKERVKAPEILPMNVPCDIIAKKGGIIEKLTVENGERAVILGQQVAEGQVLISGTVPIKNSEEKRYIHSMGSVIAATEYVKEQEFKLYKYEKKYTGEKKKTLTLSAFGKNIYKGAPSPYFNSDEELKRRVIGFFEINTLIYNEYTLRRTPLSKKQAEEEIKKEITAEFKKELSADIIKETEFEITYKDSETGIVKATARCLEEIAKEKEIEICPSEPSVPNPQTE